ncbi:MAG: hypothetical protein V3S14_01735 [Anaerolineae bacterium]
MRPDDWSPVQIERGRYSNNEGAITGYERADGLGGNPLHPACAFKDKLGKVKHAVFVDGGSAMKVYAVESDGTTTTLDLLNRVAAGSKNGPGADPDGLNLYTLLKLSLKIR